MVKKKESFEIDEILPYFDALEDPRSTINRLHPLVSVVVISLMAVPDPLPLSVPDVMRESGVV